MRSECVALLAEAGFIPAQPGMRAVRYIRFGRWLVKPGLWREFSRSPHFRVADLRRSGILRFEVSAVTDQSGLVLIREESRPKVVVFSIGEKRKDVRLLHNFDFVQEMAAMRDFSRRHVLIPETIAVDPVRRVYAQKLVASPLAPGMPGPNIDWEGELLRLASAAEIECVESREFAGETKRAIAQARAYLDDSTVACLERIFQAFCAAVVPQLPRGVPLMRCHGDLSAGNLLTGDDSRLYLIDFDRSFRAGPLFDATYLAATLDVPAVVLRTWVERVARSPEMSGVLGQINVDEYARGMMILDLLRYLEARYVAIQSGPDRVCRYSVMLLQKLLKQWFLGG